MKICSLFSGIGGIDIAFMQAGFEVVWANEFDKDAARTYRRNLGDDRLVLKDIRSIDAKGIPDFDVLVAGFPCQPFSSSGFKIGFKDTRGILFFEIARIVEAKRPSVIFLENVSNLLQHDDGKTFLTIYNALVPFGYTFRYRVMDAVDYGNVPQHRKRIFIVGFLDYDSCQQFEFPDKVKLEVGLNDILVRSAKHDQCYYYTSESKYFKELTQRVKDKNALYKIFDSGVSPKPYYICPTLTANRGTFPDRVPVILDDFGIRKITPYECLALQGYPKNFTFPNIPMNSAYKQCGNTVVVPVIRRIAEKIHMAMQSEMPSE